MVVPLSCQNPVQMANCRHRIVVPVPPLDTVPTVHVLLAVPRHPDSDRCGSDGLELFSLIAGHRKIMLAVYHIRELHTLYFKALD
jgi:hypothetical protein